MGMAVAYLDGQQDFSRALAALQVAMGIGRLCQGKPLTHSHADFPLGYQCDNSLHDTEDLLRPRPTQGPEAESQDGATRPLQLA